MVVFRKVSPVLCCDLLISLRPKEEKINVMVQLKKKVAITQYQQGIK